MATTPIKLKRSNTISVIPDTSDLIEGEVALNTVDKKFYVRDGSSQVITLANHYATDFDVNVVTFKVTVATSSSAHPYHGTGSSNKYKINGVFSPYLKLIPKVTYRFDQSDSSNSGHPLLFYYDVGKTTAFSTGVTTNGTPGSAGAYTQIIISDTTPPVLHYQCSSHANMGWALTTSTRNLTGFDTDDLSEGSTNLYFTNARAIAAISTGVGIAKSGQSIFVDLSELTDMTSSVNRTQDELILLDNGADRRKLISEIGLSAFNNDLGFTSNAGDITGVTAGTGLTGGGSSGSVTLNVNTGAVSNGANTIPTGDQVHDFVTGQGFVTSSGVTSIVVNTAAGLDGGGTTITSTGTISLSLDLSELTDMTGAVDTSVDELILLDNGSERRKRFDEIFGSNAYSSTTIPTNNNQLTNGRGFTTNTGTVTSVSGGTGLSGTVTTSGSLNLTNTGVTAATYGSSTNIPQIAVDAQGRITSASNVGVSIPSGANDATITLSAGNGLTGGEDFTTDQASDETITFNVGAGDGISVTANAVAVDSTVLRAGTGSLINEIVNANVITADMIQANSIVATIITAEEITASHIATNTITANEISAGAITAEQLQISNNSAGSAGIFMDFNFGNSRIDIRDSSALRVRIGYLA